MKKAVVLILVGVLCLSLFGCGIGGTKLTLDNYSDYLKITAQVGKGGDLIKVDEPIWLGRTNGSLKVVHSEFFTKLAGVIFSESVAPNYNYSGVKVTVRFSGNVLTVDKNSNPDSPLTYKVPFEFEGTYSLTAGGTQKGENVYFDLGNNMVPGGMAAYWEFEPEYTYEIIAVSGKVNPA